MNKPQVTIVRPEATVTVVIQGTTHTMSEAEARELHHKLTTVLNIQPTVHSERERYRHPAQWPFPQFTRQSDPLPQLPPDMRPMCSTLPTL